MDSACSPALPVLMTSVSKPVMVARRVLRFLFVISDTLPHFENWSALFLTFGLKTQDTLTLQYGVVDMPKPAANILTYSLTAPETSLSLSLNPTYSVLYDFAASMPIVMP